VKCWLARSASKTHIRIQLEPFDFAWPGWDLREGTISKVDYKALCESTDAVEIERLHQETWLRAVRRGHAVLDDLAPPETPPSLS
jgi:hypothetical protein